ncbi:MAG: AraC family transcriptional regulator [Myxococcales bacterium]|nr:MAG: AraC family transcriptional regulator [Myxococcales bacterium]
MPVAPRRAIHQNFLPPGKHRAFVWKYSEPIGGRRPRHFHAEPELNLVVRGSATFGIGDSVVTARAGELIAFPSAQDHVLLDSSPDLYLYAIGLDPALSAQALDQEPSLPLHVQLHAEELTPVLQRAADIVDRPGADSLAADLWQRVHWLARRSAPLSAQGPHVLTRRTLQLLRGAPDLSLTGLAQNLRAHPTEVSRHFHRDLGITLVRYRTRLKLLDLIQRVDSGQTELMTVAIHAGFGSYSQCHRAFQAELGCSPRRFFSGLRDGMQSAYTDESLPVEFR